jgi:hypothetical protein
VDVPGTYVVQLIVNDGKVNSAPDTVSISTQNSAPVANAGPDQTVFVTHTVTLDGSGSSDADGDPLTYTWSFVSWPGGIVPALTNPSIVNPGFVVNVPGTYVVQLIVNDGKVNSAPDTVAISTQNSPPVADAGPNQTVSVKSTVTLNGSGSSDVDGDPLTYAWSFTSRPTGSKTTLVNPTVVNPNFVVDLPGVYVVQLIVNDGKVNSAPATVTISTQNSPPVADAGPDQTVVVTQQVTFDGSGSTDVDGDSLTYAWSFTSRPTGSKATLVNPTAVNPNFVVDLPGVYVVQLIVNDGKVNSTPDTVKISTQNSPPVADAGPDQTVYMGSLVTLDGSGSHDVDHDLLTYAWSFISRPTASTATLTNPTTINPSFVVDALGDYVVQLIVNDGTVNSEPDTVTITTQNSPPVANAGPDRNANLGDTITLDGSGSYDVDRDPLTYAWSILSAPPGSTASLSDPTAVKPMLGPLVVGLYVVQLIVNDGKVNSDPVTAKITVGSGVLGLSLDGPSVGIGRSIGGTVTLGAAAPAGGVTVNLSSDDTGIATIAPTSVVIAQGETTGHVTVSGVALGSTTLKATAPNYTPASASVTVTEYLISLGAIPPVVPEQSVSLPVSLSKPAPTGGVTINLVSSQPNVATISPSTFVPAGQQTPTANPQVTGVNFGTTRITAMAAGYAPDTRDVQVALTLSFDPGTLNVVQTTTKNITLNLSAAAPTSGLTVNLSTDQPSIATVPATVKVARGQTSVQVPVTGVAIGTTQLNASATGIATAKATINVTTPPPILIDDANVGKNLQVTWGGYLGADAPAGNLQLTITSADPSRVLLSTNAATVGSASITLQVNAGSRNIPTFYIQALAGSGTVQIIASAPGYATDTSTITLKPSGFYIPRGDFTTNTFAANSDLYIQVACLDSNLNVVTYQYQEAVRGGLTVNVPVTSSNTTVGTITTSPVVFTGGAGYATTQFDPQTAGTTVISVEPPTGFNTPSNQRQITATVTAPNIWVNKDNVTVGKDLQDSVSIRRQSDRDGEAVRLLNHGE